MYDRSAPKPKPLRLIVGRNPVSEALSGGVAIEKIFLLRSANGEEISTIKRLAAQHNIPLTQVPVEKLDRFTKAQHQGVVALAGLLQYVELQDGISYVVDKGEVPLFLMLDGVTDVRNIGAIARTAWCSGAQGLILPTSHAATLGEDAIKTSAGALNKIMLLRTASVQQGMDVLRLNGIQILGTEMRGSIPIREVDFSIPTCIVMGAEDKGISKDVLKRADILIRIPMAQKFDSLNVSVAAGMILYEAMRQRN
ncbi:MAG: 23S rRNA (guanosine(2251)-2'-O)-methyltransferase RlmB [Chitinophagaceae bacterium]